MRHAAAAIDAAMLSSSIVFCFHYIRHYALFLLSDAATFYADDFHFHCLFIRHFLLSYA